MGNIYKKTVTMIMTILLVLPSVVQPAIVFAEDLGSQLDTKINLNEFNYSNDLEDSSAQIELTIEKENQNQETILVSSSKELSEVELKNPTDGVQVKKTATGMELILSKALSSKVLINLKSNNQVKNQLDWKITLPNGQSKELSARVSEIAEITETSEVVEDTLEETTASSEVSVLESTTSTEVSEEESTEEVVVESTTETSTEETVASTELEKSSRVREPGNINELLKKHGYKTLIQSMAVTDADGKELPAAGISPDATIKISLAWDIPEEVAKEMVSGDTFAFHLPKNITVTPRNGELKDGSGEVFGTYRIEADGKVEFIFNDVVEKKGHISGEFNHTQRLINIEKPGKVEIALPFEESIPPVEILVKSNSKINIAKDGNVDTQFETENINWTIDINQQMENLKNAVVTDVLPESLEQTGVEIYPVVVDINGAVKSVDKANKLTEGLDYSVVENKIVFLKEISEAYRIELSTRVKESFKTDNETGKSISIVNKAQLSADDKETVEASASVAVSYRANLSKTGPHAVQEGQQRYNWEVKANYKEHTLAAGTVFTDSFKISGNNVKPDHSMELVVDSLKIYQVTFNDQGQEVQGPLLSSSEYTVKSNGTAGFTVTLKNETKSALKLQYTTQVDGYIETGKDITLGNDFQINGEVGTGSSGITQQQNLWKTTNSVDYSNQTMTWTIHINKALYTMKDYQLIDKLSPGLSLVEESLKITNRTTGGTLVKDKDYKLTQDKENNTFTVTFIGALKQEAKDYYLIDYATKYNVEEIDKGIGSEQDNKFWNTGDHTWINPNGELVTSSTGQIERALHHEFRYNGKKAVTYDMANKIFNWGIDVNINHNALKNSTVVDTIKGNHKFVEGSIKVFESKTKADGGLEKGQEVTSEVKVDYSEDADGNTVLTYHLPEGSDKGYKIEYQTSHEGFLVTNTPVINEAIFTSNDIAHKLTASKKPDHGGETLKKTGSPNSKNANELLWEVLINPSQSQLKNVKVTDTPSLNQVIDEDSFRVHKTKINGTNIETADTLKQGVDYEVAVTTDQMTGEQEISFEFMGDYKEINDSYVLRYSSVLNNTSSSSQVIVSNSAKLSGDNIETMNTTSNHQYSVHDNDASATGKAGSVIIRKISASKNDRRDKSIRLLEGASFELWTTNGKEEKVNLFRSGTTDASGQWAFGNVRPGKYILVETEAPENHLIGEELKEGVLVEIQAVEDNEVPPIVYISNQANEATITKKNSEGQPLLGVKFQLLDENKNLVKLSDPEDPTRMIDYSNMITNAKGEINLSDLPYGIYYFEEIESIPGYALNDTPVKIEVTENGTKPVTLTNYQGKLIFEKVNENKELLAGAEFKVIKTDNPEKEIKIEETSTGVFEAKKLAPGKYTLVETKAPNGYILDQKVHEFEVKEVLTEEQIIDLGQIVNKQGSAKAIKLDEDNKALKGAEFKVVKAGTDEVVAEEIISNENGEFSVSGLVPGKYEFVEVSAPNTEYILNTERLAFEILADSADEVDAGKFINYQGRFELTKTAEDGIKLPGAEFTLFDSENNELRTNLVTVENGKLEIKNLAPGEYSLVETKSPKGYLLDERPIEFKVESSNAGKPEILTHEFLNYQGSIIFEKNNQLRESISGAIFSLKNETTGEVIHEAIKESPARSGKYEVTGLAPGEYTLTEEKAPAGFVRYTEPKSFTIDEKWTNKPLDLGTFINTKGAISFNKVSDTNEMLSGAEFDILDSNGDVVNQAPLISNVDGLVEYSELSPGSYQLVETKAPAGYILNLDPIDFTISETTDTLGEVLKLNDVVNNQGSVSMKKVSENGTGLKEVTFKLVNTTTQDVFENKTDENGVVRFTNLAPGEYVLTETKAADKFIKNTKNIDFTIEATSNGKVDEIILDDFVNYQGKLEINKLNELELPLSGAVFNVYLLEEDKEVLVEDNLVTDELGKVVVTDLAPGKYIVKEMSAPNGYILNTQEKLFYIGEEYEGVPLVQIVTIKNYQGQLDINKTDNEGNPLSGAVFAVRSTDTKLPVRTGLTTDASGKINVSNLIPGSYELVEMTAPTGFVRNEQVIPFVVDSNSDGQPENIELTMINYQGSAVIQKKDELGKALVGASFTVKHLETDTIIAQNEEVNSKGQLELSDLAPGKYEVKETKAPLGYVLNTEASYFTITSSNLNEPITLETEFTNYQGSAVVEKTDEKGNGLLGAEFVLREKETNDVVKEDLVSNDSGEILLDNLAPGLYTLEETKAPTGYILNTEPTEIEILSSSEGKPMIVSATVVNYQGSMSFTKVNSSGEVLSGAEFDVLDSEGKAVNTEALVSNESGEVTLSELAPGTYTVVETKAPTGYILNTATTEFTVSGSSADAPSVIELADVVNYQGSVSFTKVNSSGEVLSGAEFDVLDSEGKAVNTEALVSNESGEVTLSELAPGTYTVVETKAPTGYALGSEKLEFEIPSRAENEPAMIDAGQIINELIAVDEPKDTNNELSGNKGNSPKVDKTTDKSKGSTNALPKTGEELINQVLFIVVGLIVSVVSLIIMRRRFAK